MFRNVFKTHLYEICSLYKTLYNIMFVLFLHICVCFWYSLEAPSAYPALLTMMQFKPLKFLVKFQQTTFSIYLLYPAFSKKSGGTLFFGIPWGVVRGAWRVGRGAWCVARGAWCVVPSF